MPKKSAEKPKVTPKKTVAKIKKLAERAVHPRTEEQKNKVPDVVNGNNLEGVFRIDDLPFKDQMNKIFNPLQSITKTDVKDAPSDSTFVVEKKAKSKG